MGTFSLVNFCVCQILVGKPVSLQAHGLCTCLSITYTASTRCHALPGLSYLLALPMHLYNFKCAKSCCVISIIPGECLHRHFRFLIRTPSVFSWWWELTPGKALARDPVELHYFTNRQWHETPVSTSVRKSKYTEEPTLLICIES